MCGRYTLRTPQHRLTSLFQLVAAPLWEPRYNIAPTQPALIIRDDDLGRRATIARWGLIPFWAKNGAAASGLINARAETVAEKPAFRTSFRRRRCLAPADGYYEWRREGKRKLPVLYEVAGGEPFALAGLWDRAGDLETFALLTTAANTLAAEVHDRMPVILPFEAWSRWLSPESDPDALHALLVPYPATAMRATPVSSYVNNARHEGPQCLAPAEG
jgi:putative SOS response-associated peptidase YedK